MTPVRPHGKAVSAAGTVVVALVLVAVMAVTAPDVTVAPRSWSRIAVGETGTIRDLSLTVTDVRATNSLDLYGTPFTSPVALVVVRAEVVATDDPTYLGQVWLTTRDGRRYDPREEWTTAMPPVPAQPGFTVAGSWVFEVPPDRLAGAELVVENDGAEFDWYDVGLRAELGLDADAVGQQMLKLPEGSVRVTP
jgi:hypothetical protein